MFCVGVFRFSYVALVFDVCCVVVLFVVLCCFVCCCSLVFCLCLCGAGVICVVVLFCFVLFMFVDCGLFRFVSFRFASVYRCLSALGSVVLS